MSSLSSASRVEGKCSAQAKVVKVDNIVNKFLLDTIAPRLTNQMLEVKGMELTVVEDLECFWGCL